MDNQNAAIDIRFVFTAEFDPGQPQYDAAETYAHFKHQWPRRLEGISAWRQLFYRDDQRCDRCLIYGGVCVPDRRHNSCTGCEEANVECRHTGPVALSGPSNTPDAPPAALLVPGSRDNPVDLTTGVTENQPEPSQVTQLRGVPFGLAHSGRGWCNWKADQRTQQGCSLCKAYGVCVEIRHNPGACDQPGSRGSFVRGSALGTELYPYISAMRGGPNSLQDVNGYPELFDQPPDFHMQYARWVAGGELPLPPGYQLTGPPPPRPAVQLQVLPTPRRGFQQNPPPPIGPRPPQPSSYQPPPAQQAARRPLPTVASRAGRPPVPAQLVSALRPAASSAPLNPETVPPAGIFRPGPLTTPHRAPPVGVFHPRPSTAPSNTQGVPPAGASHPPQRPALPGARSSLVSNKLNRRPIYPIPEEPGPAELALGGMPLDAHNFPAIGTVAAQRYAPLQPQGASSAPSGDVQPTQDPAAAAPSRNQPSTGAPADPDFPMGDAGLEVPVDAGRLGTIAEMALAQLQDYRSSPSGTQNPASRHARLEKLGDAALARLNASSIQNPPTGHSTPDWTRRVLPQPQRSSSFTSDTPSFPRDTSQITIAPLQNLPESSNSRMLPPISLLPPARDRIAHRRTSLQAPSPGPLAVIYQSSGPVDLSASLGMPVGHPERADASLIRNPPPPHPDPTGKPGLATIPSRRVFEPEAPSALLECQEQNQDGNSCCRKPTRGFCVDLTHDPAKPAPVCDDCNQMTRAQSETALNSIALSLRAYACDGCAAIGAANPGAFASRRFQVWGLPGNAFDADAAAPPDRSVSRGPPLQLTGCDCAAKLLGRLVLCRAHRRQHLLGVRGKAEQMRQHVLARWGRMVCPFCLARAGADASDFRDAHGNEHRHVVYSCLSCYGVVVLDPAMHAGLG
ncbi:hypothetical protein F4802DRAFT_616732 [Xylaria palmicola]|nr:hypothetical protein F4802DRAFT_616732 [Xylaria palmicola]